MIAVGRTGLHNGEYMTSSSHPPAPPRVVVLVVAGRGTEPDRALAAIKAQVYEPTAVVRVSGAAEANRLIASGRIPTDYYWLLDDATLPGPEALAELVGAAEQVGASIVGSKIRNLRRPAEILSVGGATDVFGFPYTGLERGEVDQGQYDVIRDVAYVEPASLLIRRDLAEGIGGLDEKLPYLSAGLDLCRRSRLVGGRVVIAPGSEALRPESDQERPSTWREQAGRLRVMLKTYSLVTLLWTVPAFFLVGLVMGVYRMFNGARRGPLDWIMAWLWNLYRLPSTLGSRARAVSMSGDNETFLYQVRGSVQLRELGSALGFLLGSGEADEAGDPYDAGDDGRSLSDASPAFWRRPAVAAGATAALFLLVYNRSLLTDGLPVTGYALPLAESAWEALRAYAGGWHLGGLGSPEPMHPSVGATALAQALLGGRGPLAATLITVGSVAFGMTGAMRLVRRLGLGRAARLTAGAVYVAGAPVLALAGGGYWPAVAALGGLPWAWAGIAAPRSGHWLGRAGRWGRIGLASAWSACFLPVLALAPLGFGVLWAGAVRSWRPLARGMFGSLAAIPVLYPWLGAQDWRSIWGDGAGFHLAPEPWLAVPALTALAAAATAGRGLPARAALTGGLLGSLGFLAARATELGAGREVTAAGHLLASLGLALAAAGALEAPRALSASAAGTLRRSVCRVGLAAAAAVALLTLPALPAGRAGLDEDRFAEPAFAEARSDEYGPYRLLLAGPAQTLPGEYRRMEDGSAYRLLNGGASYPQAWLPDPLEGDRRLAGALEYLAEGGERRPGRMLAEYGIRWVVFTGETALADALSPQLDMRPLSGLSHRVLENEADAYRAVTDRGRPWRPVAAGYEGEAGPGRVRLAENADLRWGPDGAQDGWAAEASAAEGRAGFGPVRRFRTQSLLALAAAGALTAASLVWRPRSARAAREENIPAGADSAEVPAEGVPGEEGPA